MLCSSENFTSNTIVVRGDGYHSQDTKTILLKPYHIIRPSGQNFLAKYLRYGIVPVPLGYDPMIEVIDERDMVRALLLVLNNPQEYYLFQHHNLIFLCMRVIDGQKFQRDFKFSPQFSLKESIQSLNIS